MLRSKLCIASLHMLEPMRAIGALLTCVVLAASASAQVPGEFAQRADVRVPAGTVIARAALPAASLSAMRSADGGDLRVFNAAGQVLPYAVINAASEPQTRPDRAGERVVALPIYAEASTSTSTPTLRIEDGPKGRVIEYSASNKGDAAGKSTAVPRGLLFDTRKLDSEVRALDLEGTLPIAMILKVTVDASADLRSWQRLVTDAPVFDFGAEPGATAGTAGNTAADPSNRRIVLPAGQKLKDQYLRLTWSSPAMLTVTALRTVGVGEVSAAAPVTLDLGAPTSVADDGVEWTLPSAWRMGASGMSVTSGALALRLQTSAANTLMPVRISTRARAGDPWRAVASTVVYRLEGINPPVSAGYALDAQIRVEPLRGYKLAGVPLTLSVEYPPLHVLFVATGDGPFTIASGKAGVVSAALPLTTLIPGYRAGSEFALPVLQPQVVTSAAASPSGSGASIQDYVGKSTLLWGVLVVAVLVLAGLAISLLRSPKK